MYHVLRTHRGHHLHQLVPLATPPKLRVSWLYNVPDNGIHFLLVQIPARFLWVLSFPIQGCQTRFSLFELEESDFCNKDFVEVRRGGATGDVIGRYCGNSLPTNLTVGNQLWIKFRSSAQVQGRGFMAQYSMSTCLCSSQTRTQHRQMQRQTETNTRPHKHANTPTHGCTDSRRTHPRRGIHTHSQRHRYTRMTDRHTSCTQRQTGRVDIQTLSQKKQEFADCLTPLLCRQESEITLPYVPTTTVKCGHKRMLKFCFSRFSILKLFLVFLFPQCTEESWWEPVDSWRLPCTRTATRSTPTSPGPSSSPQVQRSTYHVSLRRLLGQVSCCRVVEFLRALGSLV